MLVCRSSDGHADTQQQAGSPFHIAHGTTTIATHLASGTSSITDIGGEGDEAKLVTFERIGEWGQAYKMAVSAPSDRDQRIFPRRLDVLSGLRRPRMFNRCILCLRETSWTTSDSALKTPWYKTKDS